MRPVDGKASVIGQAPRLWRGLGGDPRDGRPPARPTGGRGGVGGETADAAYQCGSPRRSLRAMGGLERDRYVGWNGFSRGPRLGRARKQPMKHVCFGQDLRARGCLGHSLPREGLRPGPLDAACGRSDRNRGTWAERSRTRPVGWEVRSRPAGIATSGALLRERASSMAQARTS